jgi:hypothetical protein
MDKLAEKIAKALGSAPVILLFSAWFVYHNLQTKEYVAFISDVAILIGLLILRAEQVQGDRMEKFIKKDLKHTKRVEKHLK